MQGRFKATSFGKVSEMQPDPNISQNQSYKHKEQSQYGVGRAGSDTSLPQLAVAGFDSESLAIQFANFHGRAAYAPHGVQQFLGMSTTRFVVVVTLVRDPDVKGHRHLLYLPREAITSRWFASELAQCRSSALFLRLPLLLRGALLRLASSQHDGNHERDLLFLQELHPVSREKAPVQHQSSNRNFARRDPFQQPFQHGNH